MKHITTTKALLLCAALAIGAGAHAKDKNNGNTPVQQDKGPSIGNASADDVKLANNNADNIAFSTVNPMQYDGNAAGFAGTFGTPASGAWNVLGTVDANGALTDKSSLLDFSFNKTTGAWSVTNTSATQNVTLDLTLAIHASSASTAFLFDDQGIAAGQTLSGTWQIEWLNNGGQVPGFSNAVFFGGDTTFTNVSAVPEPGTLPMVLAGFAVLGAAAWRRRSQM